MMEKQFSISVPMTAEGVSLLGAAANALSQVLVGGNTAAPQAAQVQAAPPAATTKKKPGRKPKAEKEKEAAAANQESADELDDLDLGGDELGLDEPEAPKLTLADDVIPAFRSALERVKGDKSKLAKIMNEYGVKSVQLLPEEKWAEVIAKLAKLK